MDVCALRLRLGLNGKQFARLIGCSVSTLSRWEHGHAEPDGALLAIVEAFEAATAPTGAMGPRSAVHGGDKD